MKKTSEKIIFFGSGPVAAKSLKLLANEFDIEAVVTKPAMTRAKDPVPVIDLAEKLNLQTYLPSNKKELDILISNKNLKSKLAILIDYGIIVSQAVIDYFPLGIVNSHFSLLPKWRGADPITFAILNGDKETGVSLMLITAGMDEGPLLIQKSIKIETDYTTPKLTEKLINLSDELLKSTIPKYINKEINPYPQSNKEAPTYSRKLNKLDGQIDWKKPAEQIEREIRAFEGWPKSYTTIDNREIIITKAHVVDYMGEPGKINIDNYNLYYYCSDKALSIDYLKPSGKNEMDIKSFLLGNKPSLN